jgi:hypothetical protein
MPPYYWNPPIMTPAARYFKLKASGLKLHSENLWGKEAVSDFPRRIP